MKKHEIAKLFEKIVHYYPSFTGDIEKVNAWHEIMCEIPFEVAMENLKRHAAIEKFSPTVADLSRPLVEYTDSERYHEHMKGTGIRTLEELEMLRKLAVPPTPEQKERVRRHVQSRV